MTRARIAAAARRTALIVPVAGLAFGLAAAEPLSVIGKAKGKGPKLETVTRTFARAAAIAIPDGGTAAPYPATIEVSGLGKGRLRDVDLRLKQLTHGYGSDLDILLVAPGGRSALVLSDVGSDADDGDPPITLTLDDEAPPILDLGDLPAGRFKPVNVADGSDDAFPAPAPAPTGIELSTFDGIDPNGTWKLFVYDDVGSYGGVIAGGWALTIKAKVKRDKGNGSGNGNGNGNGSGSGKGNGKRTTEGARTATRPDREDNAID